MLNQAFITCAVTGAGDTVSRSPHVPVTPEQAPERLEVKQELPARASGESPLDELIFSPTSGLLPTELQAGIDHPERFTVAHPFNPVYLLPLVEVAESTPSRSVV